MTQIPKSFIIFYASEVQNVFFKQSGYKVEWHVTGALQPIIGKQRSEKMEEMKPTADGEAQHW